MAMKKTRRRREAGPIGAKPSWERLRDFYLSRWSKENK